MGVGGPQSTLGSSCPDLSIRQGQSWGMLDEVWLELVNTEYLHYAPLYMQYLI